MVPAQLFGILAQAGGAQRTIWANQSSFLRCHTARLDGLLIKLPITRPRHGQLE
jgi:hypothetical protein